MANPAPIQFLQVLSQAYRLAGVLYRPLVGMNQSEQTEGLEVANALIDGLKTERCFVYQVIRSLFNINASQAQYTVCDPAVAAYYSATPDWPIERPEHIYRAGFIVPTSPPGDQSEIPMQVLLDYSQWTAIITKLVQAAQPRVLYYQATLPLGTASVWPVPTQNSQVAIYTPGTVDEFGSVNDLIQFPKGYREMIEYNLAVAVHDRYPFKQMAPSVEQRAVWWKSRVKAAQLTPLYIQSDPAALDRRPVPLWWDARSYPSGY